MTNKQIVMKRLSSGIEDISSIARMTNLWVKQVRNGIDNNRKSGQRIANVGARRFAALSS